MPAFTQEELEEFAHLDAIERERTIIDSVNDKKPEEVNEGAQHGDEDVYMRLDLEVERNETSAEEGIEAEMKEEAVEEFTEATEHMSPASAVEQYDDSKEQDDDVTMEDAVEDQNPEEHNDKTQFEAEETLSKVADGGSDDESESQQVSATEAEEEDDDEDEEPDNDKEEENSRDTDGSESNSESESEADSTSASASPIASASASASDSESEGEEDDDDKSQTSTVVKACSLCEKQVEDLGAGDVISCTKCHARAHQKCVHDAGVLKDVGDAKSWHCQNCAVSGTSESPKDASRKNRNSAPRLVRDLLPVSRGVQKPNSHSIFAQPLISEGEDGGRALRKRKSPTVEPPVSEKRRRRATPKVLSASLPEESRAESVAHATRRASQKALPTARILQYRPYEKAPPHKFILAFRLDQSKIEKVLNKPPRPGRRRDRRRPPKIPPPPIFHPPVPKFPALPTNHLIFPSMWGDRENDVNAKPYGGILTESEADTSRSLPQLKDRELFEIARKEAEEERRKTSAAAEAEINGESANTTKPNRTVSGPPSKIKCIQFGKFVIDTFYAAPYPEEYSHESRLFICEFCLKYLPSEFVAYRHKLKCPAKHPPGDEIYRDGSISVWEVDGRKKTEYCQCLCLMAKMFLGSKTLYYDVEPFLFYILTEYDEFGYHFVGYFSKEKRPASQNNVSCILVMPIHQRKGYATFLIDFSYLLTRIERKDGSPEKPLSDMGLTAYRSYWDLTISRHLLDIGLKPFSTRDLMRRTGMTADDVVHSLERLYAFVKDPVTKAYAIRYDQKLYENIVSDFESKNYRKLRPGNLIWTPYIMGRSDQAHLDTQPVQTIAPREGDEVAVEDTEDDQEKQKDSKITEDDDVSPKTLHNLQQSPMKTQVKDPRLVNGAGIVAPGPPSAQLLTGTVAKDESKVNVNADSEDIDGDMSTEDPLTGYALVFRNEKIPPNRFQIDPPIPPSMLRARSHKKRNAGFGRGNINGEAAPSQTVMAPVRSSPRHAASVNGSVNGTTDTGSPEKPSTPIRRSGRRSGLSNMETVGLDGSVDPDEQEIGDEIEARLESASSADSSEDEDEESLEEDNDEDEDDDDDDDVAVIDEDEDEDEDDDEEADDDPDALDIVDESEEEESDDD